MLGEGMSVISTKNWNCYALDKRDDQSDSEQVKLLEEIFTKFSKCGCTLPERIWLYTHLECERDRIANEFVKPLGKNNPKSTSIFYKFEALNEKIYKKSPNGFFCVNWSKGNYPP
jgi:hypothetical protein